MYNHIWLSYGNIKIRNIREGCDYRCKMVIGGGIQKKKWGERGTQWENVEQSWSGNKKCKLNIIRITTLSKLFKLLKKN